MLGERWDPSPRWGLLVWFAEHGTERIHPEDRGVVIAFHPSGKLFRASGEDRDWLRLQYGHITLRVHSSLFHPVDATVRDIGGRVTLIDGRVAEVIGIMWHHLRAEPMYQLSFGGKRKSKRYWNSDFAGADET
jgi:hypothetical protein